LQRSAAHAAAQITREGRRGAAGWSGGKTAQPSRHAGGKAQASGGGGTNFVSRVLELAVRSACSHKETRRTRNGGQGDRRLGNWARALASFHIAGRGALPDATHVNGCSEPRGSVQSRADCIVGVARGKVSFSRMVHPRERLQRRNQHAVTCEEFFPVAWLPAAPLQTVLLDSAAPHLPRGDSAA